MSFAGDLLTNQWLLLGVKTFAVTFVARFVLDIATGWIVAEQRSAVIGCVLAGWSAAVLLAAFVYAGWVGVLAGIVACIWHIASILRDRATPA